jgi:hypothetical protein
MPQAKRRITPIDALVLTRERIQEVLDDAVERGRMTRDDATHLLAELVRRGTAPADRLLREVDRARRAAGLGATFPITGYDDLTAAQVAERLDDLSSAQLRQVREHERRNANRKSVLTAVERKLG